MSLTEDISSAVLNGKRKEVKKLVPQALEEGIDPKTILEEGLIKPMGIIGDQFSAGEVFVPEMLVAARAMSTGTEILTWSTRAPSPRARQSSAPSRATCTTSARTSSA